MPSPPRSPRARPRPPAPPGPAPVPPLPSRAPAGAAPPARGSAARRRRRGPPCGPGRAGGLRGSGEREERESGRSGPISSAGRMSPIEMFVQGEAPAPEPHPRGGRRRLGPGSRRCRGKKHLSVAFWAAPPPPPGPGSRRAGGEPAVGAGAGSGRAAAHPPACCTLGTRPRPAGGTRLRAARGGRSTPPARPGPRAGLRHPRGSLAARCSRGPLLRSAGPGRQGLGGRKRSSGCEALRWACTNPAATETEPCALCNCEVLSQAVPSGCRLWSVCALAGRLACEQSQNHRKDLKDRIESSR